MGIIELFDFCKDTKNFTDKNWKRLHNFLKKFISEVYDYASLKGEYTKPGVFLMDDWYCFYTSGLTKYLNNSTVNLIREIRGIMLKETDVPVENFLKTEIILHKIETAQKVVITKLSDIGTANEKARILKEKIYPNIVNGKFYSRRTELKPRRSGIYRMVLQQIKGNSNMNETIHQMQQRKLTEILQKYLLKYNSSDSFIL
jgi:hypothetical protein